MQAQTSMLNFKFLPIQPITIKYVGINFIYDLPENNGKMTALAIVPSKILEQGIVI